MRAAAPAPPRRATNAQRPRMIARGIMQEPEARPVEKMARPARRARSHRVESCRRRPAQNEGALSRARTRALATTRRAPALPLHAFDARPRGSLPTTVLEARRLCCEKVLHNSNG